MARIGHLKKNKCLKKICKALNRQNGLNIKESLSMFLLKNDKNIV